MNIYEQKGNLLESTAQYIIHQTNCVSTKGKFLAHSIFTKFPYSNVYSCRHNYRDKPGSIIIKGNGKDQRYVIALMGQYYPGKARYNTDTQELRLAWFKQGLNKIGKIKDLYSIAFPKNIGCGAAGGDWEKYKKAINVFSHNYPHVKIEIIEYEPTQ